jgi:hypothetical protein
VALPASFQASGFQARFSERKGTPRYDARLPADRVVAVLVHVAEGIGTRKAARLVGVHSNTVTRYTRRAGRHARDLHDEVVAFSPPTNDVPFDETWAFVGREEKHRDPDDRRRGDGWDHVALDPESR